MIPLRKLKRDLLGRRVVGTRDGKFYVRGKIDRVAYGRDDEVYYIHYKTFSGRETHDLLTRHMVEKLLSGGRVVCSEEEYSEGRVIAKHEVAMALR